MTIPAEWRGRLAEKKTMSKTAEMIKQIHAVIDDFIKSAVQVDVEPYLTFPDDIFTHPDGISQEEFESKARTEIRNKINTPNDSGAMDFLLPNMSEEEQELLKNMDILKDAGANRYYMDLDRLDKECEIAKQINIPNNPEEGFGKRISTR